MALPQLSFSKPLPTPQEAVELRGQCPDCSSRCWMYCPSCMKPLPKCEALLPSVKLPLSLTVLRHPAENCSKSSAIPLKILSPDVQVNNLEEFDINRDFNPRTGVICFPTENAEVIEESTLDWTEINELLFIDATWTQAKAIITAIKTPAAVKFVKITGKATAFWRYNTNGFEDDSNLSTAEAMYYSVLAARARCAELRKADEGSLDDLLFIFALQHSIMVEKRGAEGRELRAKSLQNRIDQKVKMKQEKEKKKRRSWVTSKRTLT